MDKVKKNKVIKPLGTTTPRVWVVEPSFGCNLKCAHCCAGLVKNEDKTLMSYETWCSTFKIINEVSPTCRVDLCGVVGEPTLNPNLTEWLKVARELAPETQIQITTNGTMLLTGKVNYKDLLDAGANVVYTDQYGPHKTFERLAEESGYPYYSYYNKPEDAPSPWSYYGPHLKMIVLMDHPGTWPKSRLRAGLLGNWYGNLDWERAKRFNMKPLESPLTRRCNQPFLYANVSASGNYLLCCQDGMQVTSGMFGNVSEGMSGFYNFWHGKKMQLIRRNLLMKNRAGVKFACAKCNITFSRCDFKYWEDNLDTYWNGSEYVKIPEGSVLSEP